MCLAAKLNLCDILEMLIKHGAKVAVADADRQTPLSYAIKNSCIPCLKVLFDCMQKNDKG